KVVGDDLPLLVDSIIELVAISDVLIINGGLGPTVDDLTAQALSKAIDSPIKQNQQALQYLQEWAEARKFLLTESNLKQAELPAVCDIIDNPYGSAVGFSCVHNECLIMCTPGVPSELKPMVERDLLPRIREQGAIQETNIITRLRLFGITESGLQDLIDEKMVDLPNTVEIGFRVQLPVLEVKIITKGESSQALNLKWTDRFCRQFSDYIIGRDSTRLSQALNQTLLATNNTITTAESCTGGLIAAGITSEAGSSKVFEAGFVTYSNSIKSLVLDVQEETLTKFGAVSEQVVLEMASGALTTSGADVAIAVSGIAGPDGGSDDKAVGTVWIAWGKRDTLQAREFFLPMSRHRFQQLTSAIAMDLVRRDLLDLKTDVDYFGELKKNKS
ncbi:MAG: CinA family nicotinamide mononucleotide deamidase-related protein, partial [Acidiferrobacterales bacterium]|nr:CinA family nicotinamide mononucleotide deamidase-related protein [Acidiferrobacterales bacterium]